MDVLQVELAKLRRDANLSQSIEDVDKIIDQLEKTREAIKKGMIVTSYLLWNCKSGTSTNCTY